MLKSSDDYQTNPSQLFYTKDHPLCGQEEPFPGPDNLFKLARSNQNAAHIGKQLSEVLWTSI
jgi:hypothetical protein